MYMKKIILLIPLLFFFPLVAHQAAMCQCPCEINTTPIVPGSYDKTFRLSELLPNPVGDDTQLEFIELENLTAKTMQLDGWILSDASGKKYVIEGAEVKAKKFIAIERTTSNISLNNSGGETVTLISPDGKKQDAVTYVDSAKEGFSYARKNNQWQWTSAPTKNAVNVITLPNTNPELEVQLPENIQANKEVTFMAATTDADGDTVTITWSFGDGVTTKGQTAQHTFTNPGTFTLTTTADDGRGGKATETFSLDVLPYDLAQKVTINEVYPKPADGDEEWVEIVNNEGRGVELAGWSITDGVRTYVFSEENAIPKDGYVVVLKSESSISLNDTGDSVTLMRTDDSTADSISFGSAQKGKSYARIGDSWSWGSPTKGEVNQQPSQGSVLGATASAAELPASLEDKNGVAFVKSQSLIQRFWPIGLLAFAGATVLFFLYRRWKRQQAEQEEIEMME
jgi:hypothetical protein